MILESQRLFFRAWHKSDFEAAQRLWGDPEVIQFIDSRKSLRDEEVRDKLLQQIEMQEAHGISYRALLMRTPKRFRMLWSASLRQGGRCSRDRISYHASFLASGVCS